MKRVIRLTLLVLVVVTAALTHDDSTNRMMAQAGEPRFSYPAAGRFGLTSYFDHHAPTYAVDDNLTIYTTEVGLRTNGAVQSGTLWGYYTEPNNGGRDIYYDGHPAIDYGFPENRPIAAAASGRAYRRAVLGFAVAVDHTNDYWTIYGHVFDASRIANDTPVERGQQIALSDTQGTTQAHLHFEAHFNGENGPVFDPYGWRGYWYSPQDPWNQPFRHTEAWWRSGVPIPMGYRDQNHVAQGPYQLTGTMQDKWEERNGFPGAPVGNRGLNNCPDNYYGDCQFFERGYVRWNYISSEWHQYPSTIVDRVHYNPANNWNATLHITNNDVSSGQVSVLFVEGGHVVDSITYLLLPNGTTWDLNVQQALQEVIRDGSFGGVAEVYSNRVIAVTITRQPEIQNAFLPLTTNSSVTQ